MSEIENLQGKIRFSIFDGSSVELAKVIRNGLLYGLQLTNIAVLSEGGLFKSSTVRLEFSGSAVNLKRFAVEVRSYE